MFNVYNLLNTGNGHSYIYDMCVIPFCGADWRTSADGLCVRLGLGCQVRASSRALSVEKLRFPQLNFHTGIC